MPGNMSTVLSTSSILKLSMHATSSSIPHHAELSQPLPMTVWHRGTGSSVHIHYSHCTATSMIHPCCHPLILATHAVVHATHVQIRMAKLRLKTSRLQFLTPHWLPSPLLYPTFPFAATHPAQPFDYYVANYPESGDVVLGFLTWPLLLSAELDHVYTAWYFYLSLALLAASLVACTWTRQWPAVKVGGGLGQDTGVAWTGAGVLGSEWVWVWVNLWVGADAGGGHN